MKKLSVILLVFGILLTIASCKSLKKVKITDVTSNIPTDSITNAVSAEVDFKSDEVLCATNERSMNANYYKAAKILTPASPATKNQAKVLFLDGKEKWAKFVMPSHKSLKNEMIVGKYILYSPYSKYEDVSSDDYRKSYWYLGRITSTDELFKDMVEVKGKKYYVKWVRTPETIIK